ncbi:sodium-dependent nutrient amino acid transporter 1 isoform X1 [Stomoxys calcitrans]|uniref:Transporter n=2 Tax=Stomoxys calcitrans TaxID=35570 RepID=A0A1I8Q6E3_STOCA|nr:sodium-dependent nutrient amino acid transporter 1 isoform X1 [Stomoxys calcitrans]XP_013106367.1 sodium-dependent nutrient amino acid transporter 1 isoform X1 [Stomoxys calcitrans]XP_013106368.1 sodium-dependent nutrient amino acid transporter 1 isoform X1 [Stomoxys calcitrans]XP_013106369.1 sodium-dependent nutrient amino acid transporter 1 isoform X1 [Stomoxys calcitrans]XP_013106370.1 sodium-dependent nutrient amino acid transporter 1 isoform X1 [Stomoxys calcitrans]
MDVKTNEDSGRVTTTVSIELSNNTNQKKTKDKDDNADDRPNWSNGLEFLMSCISMSVGLGNIWRFPFTAYENGGGAFLIPYLIVLFLIGKPMYYLEMIMGQFTSKGSVKAWSICPSFLGVGYGQAFGTLSIITYYSSLIALTLYYMIVSCQAILPWTYCRDEWENCVDSMPKEDTLQFPNDTSNKLTSSSELYFIEIVSKEKDQIDDGLGSPDLYLTLTLFASWIVIFLVIRNGVKSSGKAAYFLALFPYVVLIALLIRAVTLEGAVDGILFFLEPDWGQLANLKVWKEAVVQCFFSLAVGIGPIIMFSSYNRFDHPIYRDAMIVTSLDTLTSMLAGITIFGILGNLAHNLKVSDIKEVVQSGTALAFISYPDAIAKFQAVPQFFAVLFFFMLFVLGVGSIVALQSTIVTIICDQFKSTKYWVVALICSIGGFLLGLVYVTPGGQWILNLVDFYGGTYVVFALAILEIVGIIWIYGLQNFCDDVEFMTNRKVSIYWRLCWSFLTPVMMIVIFVYSMVTIEPLTYKKIEYPEAANIAGWVIFAIGIAQFPLWGWWYIKTHYKDSFMNTLRTSLRSSEEWGPKNPETRAKWIAYKEALALERGKKLSSNKFGFFKQKVYNISVGKN